MLAYGEVMYSRSRIINDLISEAKDIINGKPREMSELEIELTKYGIDDLYKDFEDAIINEELIGVELIRHKILNKSIDVFCEMNRIWRTKDKRLREQLEEIDLEFVLAIESAMNQNWRENSSMDKLRVITENLLGGRRTKEWNLKSKLDI